MKDFVRILDKLAQSVGPITKGIKKFEQKMEAVKGLIPVGFWKDTKSPFGGDIAKLLPGFSDVFSPYPDPRELVDLGFYQGAEEVIAVYLDGGKRVEQYLGYSYCRFGCGHEVDMGTADLSDGVYLWPEGLSHYVRVHKVRLPGEFIGHIVKRIQKVLEAK